MTQQAMVDGDHSMTNGFLLIITLVFMDIAFSLLKMRSPLVDRLTQDKPLIIVEDGRPLKERMLKTRVAEEDVLMAARQSLGLERMSQIKHAVLETSGEISVIRAHDPGLGNFPQD